MVGKYTFRDYGTDADESEYGQEGRTSLPGMDFNQQVLSLTGSYSLKSQKLMLTASAAVETTIEDAKFQNPESRFDKTTTAFLPSILLAYNPGGKSRFRLRFMKLAYRPDIEYLNPYRDDSDPAHIRGEIRT